MKTHYSRVIGVDVASDELEIDDSERKITHAMPNTVATVAKKLVARIQSPSSTLVVCEATGGNEHVLVDAMHEAGIPVCIANPRQVRDFAKGHGYLEKSDVIDARMIRRFGEDVEIHLTKQRSPEEKRHQSLVRQRCQVMGLLNAERNRLAQTHDCQNLGLSAGRRSQS